MVKQLQAEIQQLANPTRAKVLTRFFKTGPGEYGHGDVFLGLTVPQSRTLARKYQDLLLKDLDRLLKSKIHEERALALIILINRFSKAGDPTRKKIYDFYLAHITHINNWDLVDISAPRIVGEYLLDKPLAPLFKLAASKNIWERRIAILSTFPFVYQGNPSPTFQISELLLNDKEDLIHKAVGWLLREVGKRISQGTEEGFLKKHYKVMPRTMLRYAIERFPSRLRLKYLKGQI